MDEVWRLNHDWQCPWNFEQQPSDCECGTLRPRRPWMDLYPLHRPPTREEADAARGKQG